MNSAAHRRVIAAFPAALPWQVKKRPIGGPFPDPGAMAGGSGHMDEDEDDEEDEEDEEDGKGDLLRIEGVHPVQTDFHPYTGARRRTRQERNQQERLSNDQRWAQQIRWNEQHYNAQQQHNNELRAMQGDMQAMRVDLTTMLAMMAQLNPNYVPPQPPQPPEE